MKNTLKHCLSFVLALVALGCNQGDGDKKKTTETPGRSESPSDPKGAEKGPNSFEAILKDLPVDFEAGTVRPLDKVEGLANQPTSIVPKLMEQFCVHVYKLKLYSNFDTELAYFCGSDKKPTKLFSDVDRYAKITKSDPVAAEIEHSIDGDFAKSIVVVAYELPIPPKFVKEANIHRYMTAPAKFPYFKQTGKVLEDLGKNLGGDLQFNKYKLSYETENYTSDGKTFKNSKETEFNGYQVQGGNSDIGIGMEHLLGDKNPNYKYFKTITITIGTQSGGSLMVNFASVIVRHNGYTEDARKSASDIGTAQGSHVLEGVLKEMADRIIK